MPNRYHISVFAKIYKVSEGCIRKTAINYGIKGTYYTINDIVKMGYPDIVFYLNYVFPDPECYSSRLNNTKEFLLPDWPKHTQTHTIITK